MIEVAKKYRGKRIDNGEYVFGDLFQGAITKIVTPSAEYRVDSKSIYQLAGYDSNGNEVYKSRGKPQ